MTVSAELLVEPPWDAVVQLVQQVGVSALPPAEGSVVVRPQDTVSATLLPLLPPYPATDLFPSPRLYPRSA